LRTNAAHPEHIRAVHPLQERLLAKAGQLSQFLSSLRRPASRQQPMGRPNTGSPQPGSVRFTDPFDLINRGHNE
jgi:hypothetical protein